MHRLLPLIALVSIGCGSSMPSLTAPSSATVSAVSVSGTGTSARPRHLQMSATARYEEGSWTKDVTNLSTWQTSDPTVATVAADGALTEVSDGRATITATYQGVSGALTLEFSGDDVIPEG